MNNNDRAKVSALPLESRLSGRTTALQRGIRTGQLELPFKTYYFE